jgi:hybrid polyketide synthase / nonribosomal peptide synthetase ACE1
VHRVDQIAHSQPQEIAVRHGKISSTYAEVLAHANAVTAALQAANVTIASPVAVLLEVSPTWISTLLGIMRAGAVYVPLDLSLPWARLAAMVHDCQPSMILVDKDSKQYVSKLKRPEIQVIDVSSVERQDDESTVISASADDPAVILYTSGSSGAPKGILLKHEGLRNWTEPIARSFNLGREVVLQQTSPTFDLSLVQIFTALCFGGSLYLISRQQRGDAEAISKIVADQGVTFTCATPSEYATWLHYGKRNLHSSAAWKTALCAGEPVPFSLVEKFASLGRTDLTLYNLYGPTETSLTCTATQVSLNTSCGPIAAGHPLPNYSVYVVDEQLRPVPVGMQGEIYIGGPGVGLGYLNQPELTSARFVPNILDKPKDDAGSWKTMHRTGDLGRWLKDGQLLVEGRIDTQVKLRGLRIDLAEVEHVILDVADGELCEAVVSVRRSSLDEPDLLIAHIVFARADTNRQHLGVIQSRLSKRLPKYMCPAAFVSLDKLPTTISGKLDRKLIAKLPLPSGRNRLGAGEDKEEVVTLTDTETRLKKIWEETLGLQRSITAQTDFFHVGGSSLLLLSLVARIKETFNCDLSLVRMFESSTLGAMAHQIDHGLSYDVGADAIDWNKETALLPELLDLNIKRAHSSIYTSPERDAKPKVVVLTGATGKLGRALLDTLVAEPLIDHVHCIGVRNTRDRADMAALDKNKVTMHVGDLVLLDLGLSGEDAAAVFGAADAVIHNGADMSYLKTYASLRAANLKSTQDLVRMIARHSGGRSVPFHYVSTVSVGNIVATALANGANLMDGAGDVGSSPGAPEAQDLEKGSFVFRPVSVAAYPPPSVVSYSDIARTAHGYVATKWASEVFLEHLHERYPEWPVVIHRPSLIAGQSSKEEAGGARLEFVENLRRYSSLLRAVPEVPAIADKRVSVDGSFDVVPLGDVVKEMVDSLRRSLTHVREERGAGGEGEGEGVSFLHHIGGLELFSLHDVRSLVAKSDGHGDEDIRPMDVLDWARKAGELGMHPTMVALFESLAAAEGRLVFPRLARW